jgi:hypothetical protein
MRGREELFRVAVRFDVLASPHDVLTTLVLQIEPSFV